MYYFPPIDFLKISEHLLDIIKQYPQISGMLFVIFCFVMSFSIISKDTIEYNKKLLRERFPGKRSLKSHMISIFFLALGIIVSIIMIG